MHGTAKRVGPGEEPTASSSKSISQIFQELQTSDQGLSETEAARRLDVYGPNELPRQTLGWLKVVENQFRNPMFLILFVVSVLAGFLGQTEQALVIVVIMGVSAILGFYNEFRAERLVQELEKTVSIKAVVTRDGKPREVDSVSIVPGDILNVYIGDIVAADARIIHSKELEIDQAVLTGEPFPVEKTPEIPKVRALGFVDAANMMFMGTVVVRGSALGIVVSTGKNSAFGSISKTLGRTHPETEFQRGTKRYGNLLLYLTFFLAIGIFGFNALVGHALLNSLLFSLAVAIGIVPELMPGIVTISLSRGAHKMAKSQVIIKRLASMENLGNIDVLCTDKTGTLTEGKIILNKVLSSDLKPDSGILRLALACNAAVVGATLVGNPMDVATWEYAIQNGQENSVSEIARIDEIPFDYERRIMSVVVKNGKGERMLISKGAPESVLHRCNYVEMEGRIIPITSEVSLHIESEIASLSKEGLRVLAISYRSIEAKDLYDTSDESELILTGFLVFSDPPKQGAGLAIAKLRELGVETKVLTGDNELVAKKTCEELNIEVERIVTGENLAVMSLVEVKKAAEESTIFARVTPEQKLDLIRALKEDGHVVGYMGDGVNDAPALYEADAGISVDSAVDVSKAAADIVLLRKDLGVLSNGIEEGRRTFGNTIKYVLMGTSSNFGNMFSASAASIFLPFLPMLPMQILFMNLLYNVANLTLPTDNVDPEYSKWPKRWDIRFVRNFTLFFGPFSSVYDFLTFGIMLFIFGASASLFQSAWFVESFWTEVLIIFVIRTRRLPFFTSKPGRWVVILTLCAVAFGTVLPFTSLGGFMLLVPLPIGFWILNLLMTVTYLFLVDAGKVFFYKVCGY